DPSLWDDYRNKLVLLELLAPDTTSDVIQSMIERGNATGFMPTFFHGDHAAPFIAGSYLRGLRGFDIERAYELLLNNATNEHSRARPHVAEFASRGYISTPPVDAPNVETKAKAGVTKTLEYAYDDYALAQLAKALGRDNDYRMLIERSKNYANLFDSETGLMRGRRENGDWVEPFDAKYPYYEYMYREANAWQSSFFAPHDTEGLIKLYASPQAFEAQLDKLFSIPWDPNHIAMNVNSFIGQYCHGNQPDHGFPYLYYWIDKPEKTQAILDEIMERFYGMEDGRTLCGMDDAGEMSSWYVFNAIGLYPYSPADPKLLACVPLFDEIRVNLAQGAIVITKEGSGRKITKLICDGKSREGYSIDYQDLAQGKSLKIETTSASNSDQ
ncbi:MAG: glycoside hydrolase family 92 protein, partial [Planctomycetales bacterium]|nr:glycoside hydrolase family 92 protein [Planctomycetales bacterium]